ncbi:MAG: YeeE/YedE family protein [Polyangiaceae bacterium]|nr:YeeE/YedE family protein [Polyangiaceae bacterium]
MREKVFVALVAVALGFSLNRIGFSSWDEVHAMFLFSDLRLFLTFASAVGFLAVAWIAVRRVSRPRWAPRPIHRGTVLGGALFGLGWAIAGACPAVALVQIGEGQLGALFTLGGVLLGNLVYSVVHERWLRWDTARCDT